MKTIFKPAVLALFVVLVPTARAQTPPAPCQGLVRADVVAFEAPRALNRWGSVLAHSGMLALARDVVPEGAEHGLAPGHVRLRPDKRPRPLVLRVAAGDCLEIRLRNLLAPERTHPGQSATRTTGLHVDGMQLVHSIRDDGTFVGDNPSGLVRPGEARVYTLYAEHEGTFLMAGTAALFGGPGDAGRVGSGLFGAVHVEPRGSRWYRSQVTREELAAATVGRTPAGQPILDYEAAFPAGHPRAGQPVLAMLDAEHRLVHGDLTAVIVPHDEEAFREITVLYHENWGQEPAFGNLYSQLGGTIWPGSDNMAINYASEGMIGRVLANRFGVGPAGRCAECKFEEFFLSSWAAGDPALLVDVAADAKDENGRLRLGPKATRVLYPDDPANVYPSYLGDAVRFRVLHGGTRMHHVHHTHAHAWRQSPDNPDSRFIDSQPMTSGAAFTMAMSHGTSGRAAMVGDSLFHCHIYFHFAMGMWGVWRVHDVFEEGTELDASGRPVAGARALPDGELQRGVPIPGVIPLPGRPMPPMPAPVRLRDGGRRVEVVGDGHPGFPFFIPGVAGRRAPRPPLDTVDDGGLPRHVALDDSRGEKSDEVHQVVSRLDFSKSLRRFAARELPEAGTELERRAMDFHAHGRHPSFTPAGQPAEFAVNGLGPRPGAPFADPCAPGGGDDPPTRRYRAAAFQLDVVFNKKGWHYPQQRILGLWHDVAPTLAGERPPEPLFFRANSGECVELEHTNLVPNVQEGDDFVVRTPTDILGQHIHLVRFDVLASDGAANGFNYEDGTLSPDEVRERIAAINEAGGLLGTAGERRPLTARPHPFFGTGPGEAWLGAQTTLQRWYAEPLLEQDGDDRTLRTVFTHDHFGPSTHQQSGLFAGLLVEPAGSRWRDPESGEFFGGRDDGGPTRWRADILTPEESASFRELALAFQAQQPAYRPGGDAGDLGADPQRALRPPEQAIETMAKEVPDTSSFSFSMLCNNGLPAPCPHVVSENHTGIAVVNYRNEPLPLRLAGADPATPAGDLAHVLRSIERADPELGRHDATYPLLGEGIEPHDPFTPLLRAYEGDRVEIRVLSAHDVSVGSFSMAGVDWPFEAGDPRAGRRAAHTMSTGDALEIAWTAPPSELPRVDYAYFTNADSNALAHGPWGLLRVYDGAVGLRDDLLPLPANPDGQASFRGSVCPPGAPVRRFEITATSAAQALPGGRLVYAERDGAEPLIDANALLYVRSEDLDADGRWRPGAPIEPLVLRAAAGDCVEVELHNALDPSLPVFHQENLVEDMFTYVDAVFADVPLYTSTAVGLRPQLLALDAGTDLGANLGANPPQTVAPEQSRVYRWYAGVLEPTVGEDGEASWRAVPVELGTVNLLPADPFEQHPQGLFGALVVEPEGARWEHDPGTRAAATVVLPDGARFREMVLMPQMDLELSFRGEPLEKWSRGINYRAKSDFYRLGFDRDAFDPHDADLTCWRSNRMPGAEADTPVFSAPAGMQVRFRLANPGNHLSHLASFHLHGHVFQEDPRSPDGRRIEANPLSAWTSVRPGLGSQQHADVVIEHAGGAFGVPGDYLYRFHPSRSLETAQWGIFRVRDGAESPAAEDEPVIICRPPPPPPPTPPPPPPPPPTPPPAD